MKKKTFVFIGTKWCYRTFRSLTELLNLNLKLNYCSIFSQILKKNVIEIKKNTNYSDPEKILPNIIAPLLPHILHKTINKFSIISTTQEYNINDKSKRNLLLMFFSSKSKS